MAYAFNTPADRTGGGDYPAPQVPEDIRVHRADDLSVEFPLERLKIATAVIAVSLVLIALARDVFLGVYGYDTPVRSLHQFRLDSENNFGAWFASVMLLGNAFLAFLSSRSAYRGHRHDKSVGRNWALIALVLVCMSFEEIVGFHEKTNDPLRALLDADGILYYTWVIPGAALVLIVGAYFLPFLWKIPRNTAVGLFVAGAIYVSGALGMELVGAPIAAAGDYESLGYRASVLLEESLELTGLVVTFWTLANYLRARTSTLKLV